MARRKNRKKALNRRKVAKTERNFNEKKWQSRYKMAKAAKWQGAI